MNELYVCVFFFFSFLVPFLMHITSALDFDLYNEQIIFREKFCFRKQLNYTVHFDMHVKIIGQLKFVVYGLSSNNKRHTHATVAFSFHSIRVNYLIKMPPIIKPLSMKYFTLAFVCVGVCGFCFVFLETQFRADFYRFAPYFTGI